MWSLAVTLLALLLPPAPTRWVTDTTGFLSSEARTQLDAKLESYEKQTGHQVVVWIGDTLGGAPLDEWAVKTFEAWKLGRKGHDDGLALFLFASDRKIAIEVGYGLEGVVPDAIANRVIQETMAPRLREGDRDGAVTAGVDAILAAIEGKPVAGPPPGGSTVRMPWAGPFLPKLILGGLAAAIFILLFIFNPRLALLLLWTMSGHRRRGGGLFGGGGGGFSGGGGRSGGGGARGSW
jgi:uncharacterized protein